MAGGWQPIETAPKDGSVILLADYSGYPEHGFKGFWIGTGRWIESDDPRLEAGHWATCYDEYLYTPTHWMPLPEPPESAA